MEVIILIEAVYNRKKLTLELSGHAGYAPAGRDTVCAAVSALVYTLINCSQCSYDTAEKTCVRLRRGIKNRVRFDTVLCGLFMIADSYPDNLTLQKANE